MERTENPPQQYAGTTALCNKMLRVSTGVVLLAFVLIVGMTTFSTGPFVRSCGQVLYYVIVLDGFFSLGVWLLRARLEKRLQEVDISR